MDSGACVHQSNNCQDAPQKFSENLDEVSNKGDVQLATVADGTASLGPITPVPTREIGDTTFDCNTPLTEVKRPTKVSCFDSKTGRNEDPVACGDDSSPRTPRDVVFDPFAPGPDNMAMAPLCKKYVDKMRTSVARRLSFDSSSFKLVEDGTYINDLESISDEEMFESVYNNLLEVIVSKQTEGLLAEISNIEWDSDCCKTPPAPHLSGVAETCPGAPMKPSAKSRNIDLGLCRKLEF